MSVIEKNGLMRYVDKDGNQSLLYPITKAELVDGAVQTVNGIAPDDNGNVEIVAGTQPDWNQNDETQPDFVKNRTHYAIVTPTTLLASKAVPFEDDGSGSYSANLDIVWAVIRDGDMFRVTWDGDVYEVPVVDYTEVILGIPASDSCYFFLVGNPLVIGGEDNGIPFAIAFQNLSDFGGGLMCAIIAVTSTESEHIIEITHEAEIVTKLPVKFIPETIQRKLTGSDSQFVGFDTNGNAVAFTPEFVGKNVTDTEYTIDDAAVTADIGAEIFNNYRENKASGRYSHAEGSSTTASGAFSHAEGYYTTASGNTSHAEGSSTTASGSTSHAEGANTTASGQCSHAEGNATTASGLGSHVEGVNSEAIGSYSHAEGQGTTASGNMSHAEGLTTEASGEYSHAEGWNAKATNECSHAEGYSTTASGEYSHADGYSTTASGQCSHAEGNDTTASGQCSHAEGYYTTASGNTSHAEGQGTTASGNYQHVQGQYNIEDSSNKYAHIVGNGDSTTRSNAHTIDWKGNAWFQGDVYVCGTGQDDAAAVKLSKEGHTHIASEVGAAEADHTHDDYFPVSGGTINGDTNVVGVLRSNGQQAFYYATTTKSQTIGTGNATGGTIIACGDEANTTINGANVKMKNALPQASNTHTLGTTSARWKEIYSNSAVNVTSDRRLKRDINYVGDPKAFLDFINSLKVATYNYNDDEANTQARIGLIAQDVQEADADLSKFFVTEGEDSMLGMTPANLVFALIAAVQKLSAEVEELKSTK